MAGNGIKYMRKAGRPVRPNSKRHNILIDNEVWEYLNRNRKASAEIEQITREIESARNVCEWLDAQLRGPVTEISLFEVIPLMREWLARKAQ